MIDSVHTVDGFASAAECNEILAELAHALWKPSRNYRRQEDGTFRGVPGDDRLSETAHQEFFPARIVELLGNIEERLTRSFGVNAATLEWWQATSYPIGGMLGYHLDSGYWDDHYAGDRVATFLLYLTTPLEGGGTHFRALDLLVEAEAGRLVAWDNLFPDGRPSHLMIHAGTPVLAGEKVTLVTWQRQRPFRLAAPAA